MAEEELIPSEAPQESKGSGTKKYLIIAVGIIVLLILGVFAVPMVISVLFFTGALNPVMATGPTMCTFPSGVLCTAYKLHTDGSLDLMLAEQAQQHPIRVDGIACVPKDAAEPSVYTPINTEIPLGEQRRVSGVNASATVHCGSGGQLGTLTAWKIWVKYTETDTGTQNKISGDMTAQYGDCERVGPRCRN